MRPALKSKIYLCIVVVTAFLIGWAFHSYVKPTIIEAGCDQIASQSNGLYYREREIIDPAYNYDNIKERCLQDIKYAQEKY